MVSHHQHCFCPPCSFVASCGDARHSRPAENKAGNEAKWALWEAISDWNVRGVCTEGRETCVHPLPRVSHSPIMRRPAPVLKSDMASLSFPISFFPSSSGTPPSPSTAPLIFIEANASSVIFLLCGPLMRFCQVNLSDKATALIRHPSSVPASTFLFSTATSLITGFVATLSQFYAYKLLTLSFC